MAPDEGAALKLRAEDAEDLAVISACLQDALVAVRDLAYAPEDRSFLFVANRFRWESGLRPAPGETPYQRALCGITFSEVTAHPIAGFAAAITAGYCRCWRSGRRTARSISNFPAARQSGSRSARILCQPGTSASLGRHHGSPATIWMSVVTGEPG